MDIRYKYRNEDVEDGIFKFVFMKSAENKSNIVTKKLNGDMYEKYSKQMIGE